MFLFDVLIGQLELILAAFSSTFCVSLKKFSGTIPINRSCLDSIKTKFQSVQILFSGIKRIFGAKVQERDSGT